MVRMLRQLDAVGARHATILTLSAALLGVAAVLPPAVLALEAVFDPPEDQSFAVGARGFWLPVVAVGLGWLLLTSGLTLRSRQRVLSLRLRWTAVAMFIVVTAGLIAVVARIDDAANARARTPSFKYGATVEDRYIYSAAGGEGRRALCLDGVAAHPASFSGYSPRLALKGCLAEEWALDN